MIVIISRNQALPAIFCQYSLMENHIGQLLSASANLGLYRSMIVSVQQFPLSSLFIITFWVIFVQKNIHGAAPDFTFLFFISEKIFYCPAIKTAL